MSTFVRTGKSRRKRKSAPRGRESESSRWADQVLSSQGRLQAGTRAIHVMDREGDSYELFCNLDGSASFVVRAAHDRVVTLPSAFRLGEHDKLREVVAAAPVILHREVPLSRRRSAPFPNQRRIHPPRQARVARLAISTARVTIARSGYAARALPPSLDLNVVRVIEIDPPVDAKPVEWILITNLPIATTAEVEAVVDSYRARWLIEEFFKALKTGCQYESRQLEDRHALLNALATLVPVAWRLLLLRYLAQHAPDVPAEQALTKNQIAVLRACSPTKLLARVTVREALLAVASLGGHIKNNGEPGWQVLGRGFQDLLMFEIGWSARRRAEK